MQLKCFNNASIKRIVTNKNYRKHSVPYTYIIKLLSLLLSRLKGAGEGGSVVDFHLFIVSDKWDYGNASYQELFTKLKKSFPCQSCRIFNFCKYS